MTIDRIIKGNEQSILVDGAYVLVVLNRALRSEDNPVIDAAIAHANQLNLGILVYSEVDETVDYACERIFYFILGAYRELAIALEKKKIKCVQVIRKAEEEDTLQLLTSKAAVIYTDEDYTHWDRAKIQRILDIACQTVFLVDASRLVPTRQLPPNLKTTPEFRKAHNKLRDTYFAQYKAVNEEQLVIAAIKDLPIEHNFAHYSDHDLENLLKQCNINHDIKISALHPPTQAEINQRLAIVKTKIVAKYKWIRNNPALEYSTSQLSPYLHFGMISPQQVLAAIKSSDIPKSYTWKFRDELLTWREWFHYQAFYNLNLHCYDFLPDDAKETLLDHTDDPRPDLCSFEDIIQGRTSDRTWNAAQREWLNTGWLHNNLRMYWAKQIIRFTKTPQQAWDIACYLNDHISLDGCDPATYGSIRWAFGDGKPGYSEKPIYGKVSPKSDRAILNREGMKQWIETRTSDLC